jgi:heat-inducible transcriptional repressor
MSEIDKILEYATKLVSEMTKYTGLAVKPPNNIVTVMRYEAICLDEYNLLLIIMFTEDDIRTMRVRSMLPLTRECTSKLVSVLNTYAAGVSADKITLPLIVAKEEQMGPWGSLIDSIMKSVYTAMNEKNGGGVMIEGVYNLLQYPEYSDISAVKDLLSIFDREEEIVKLISDAEDDDNVNVYIGSENAFDVRGQSSLVFRKIRRGGKLVGAIGIIGPRRMNYARVITLIDRLTGGIAKNLRGDSSNGDSSGVRNSS